MISYCCWLTQRCESECFRAPRRHPKVQNIRKHRRTPSNGKKTDTFLKTLPPPLPNVAPGNCLFCGVRRGHAVRRRGGAARRSRAARPARRGLRGAACDARRRPAATPQGVARGGAARAAARGGALDHLSNMPSRRTETTSKAEVDNETELGKSKCERRKQAKPVSARR